MTSDSQWLARLQEFLNHPAPAFLCTDCGQEELPARYVAELRHVGFAPASAEAMSLLAKMGVPDPDKVTALVELHNGFHLYQQRTNHKSGLDAQIGEGIEVFPVEFWAEKTHECREEWIEHCGEDGEDAELPYGPNDFLAIGHPRGSWNYFHWVTRGPCKGRVYWWPWTMPPEGPDEFFTEDFPLFICALYYDPVYVLNEVLCCYSRYADGETETQWVPLRYAADQSEFA